VDAALLLRLTATATTTQMNQSCASPTISGSSSFQFAVTFCCCSCGQFRDVAFQVTRKLSATSYLTEQFAMDKQCMLHIKVT